MNEVRVSFGNSLLGRRFFVNLGGFGVRRRKVYSSFWRNWIRPALSPQRLAGVISSFCQKTRFYSKPRRGVRLAARFEGGGNGWALGDGVARRWAAGSSPLLEGAGSFSSFGRKVVCWRLRGKGTNGRAGRHSPELFTSFCRNSIRPAPCPLRLARLFTSFCRNSIRPAPRPLRLAGVPSSMVVRSGGVRGSSRRTRTRTRTLCLVAGPLLLGAKMFTTPSLLYSTLLATPPEHRCEWTLDRPLAT